MTLYILVDDTNIFKKYTLYFFRRREFNFEDGTDKWLRNFDKELPLQPA
jgi:hypothetical protein